MTAETVTVIAALVNVSWLGGLTAGLYQLDRRIDELREDLAESPAKKSHL